MPIPFLRFLYRKIIQRDPSGFKDGVNLYRYAWNNPQNFIDPSGLESDDENNELDPVISREVDKEVADDLAKNFNGHSAEEYEKLGKYS